MKTLLVHSKPNDPRVAAQVERWQAQHPDGTPTALGNDSAMTITSDPTNWEALVSGELKNCEALVEGYRQQNISVMQLGRLVAPKEKAK